MQMIVSFKTATTIFIMRQTKKNILLFIISISLSTSLLAQVNFDHLKPRHLKKYGNNAIRNGDIYSAIDYFEKYCSLKSKDIKETFTLAELYEKSRNYNQAAKQYKQVYKSDSIKFVKALFKYALMLKMNCEYDSAKTFFTQFQIQYKEIKSDKNLNLLLANEIEGYSMTEAIQKKKQNSKNYTS